MSPAIRPAIVAGINGLQGTIGALTVPATVEGAAAVVRHAELIETSRNSNLNSSRKTNSMAYWGSNAEDCDFAFDAVGSYIVHIKKAMLRDAAVAIERAYPEQSILASLKAIYCLWDSFPKNVSCAFPRRAFEESKLLFSAWIAAAGPHISSSRRTSLLAEADAIFSKCERMYPPAHGK